MRSEETIAVGLVVAMMRQEQGMTVAALAMKAKLSLQRLMAIEEGFEHREKDLIRLAHALKTSPAVLKGESAATGIEARAPFRALKAKLEALSPAKQDELCAIFYTSFLVAEGRVADGLGKEGGRE